MKKDSKINLVRADTCSFIGDDGKSIVITGTMDGRLIVNRKSFITARHPINILDD